MADKVEVNAEKKAKEPWNAKKVITTIIIAALSLLMIGGAYYIVVLVKDSTNDTYVFGTYDGKKIKYEPGTEFYLRLMNDAAYNEALQTGDYSTMLASWQQAYQYQVLMTAGLEKAKQAKISAPKDLVNDAIIASGIYANEDGSKSFDADVYKSVDSATRDSYYKYMEERYPYSRVLEDVYSVLTSDKEAQFVADMSKATRDFEVFEVDYLAYPDYLAYAYDISAMEKTTDENGNELAPTLEEIKAYIYSSNPDEVKPYIENNYASASANATNDFERAATFGNGLSKISGAANNVGQSIYFLNGIEYQDYEGPIAEIYSEDVAKDLYTSEVGSVFSYPTSTGYVFVRVASDEPNENFADFTKTMFNSYSTETSYVDFANQTLLSDKHVDDFYTKFINLLFGTSAVSAQ